jgi:predicted metalloprotease
MPCRCVRRRQQRASGTPEAENQKKGWAPLRLAAGIGIAVLVVFAIALIGSVMMMVLLPIAQQMEQQARYTWPVLIRDGRTQATDSR